VNAAVACVLPRLLPLVIAGSRGLLVTSDQIHEEVDAMLAEFNLVPNEVVSGCAPGIDRCGEAWATAVHLPIKRFPAQWAKYGRSAGPRRNMEMGQYGGALLAFWDGSSRGTQDMVAQMRDRRKPVRVVEVRR
jgi:hypothetical protein